MTKREEGAIVAVTADWRGGKDPNKTTAKFSRPLPVYCIPFMIMYE